jgi:serine/threonine-protein kinase
MRSRVGKPWLALSLALAAPFAARPASAGQRKPVPEVVDLQEADARALLSTAGFDAKATDVPGEPAGTVASQSPGGFSWAAAGDVVAIAVRRGGMWTPGRDPRVAPPTSVPTPNPPSPSPAATTVAVPGVVGLDQDAAMRQLAAAGLSPLPSSVSAEAAWSGRVVGQEPAPGTVVARGSGVSIQVGRATAGLLQETEVPGLVGLAEADARALAAQAGFAVLAKDRLAGETGGVGLVLEQDPPAGSRLLRGRTLTVTVGRLLLLPVRVPDAAGLDQASAEKAVRDAGFGVETTSAATLPGSAGRVVSQDPAAGAMAYRGSTVRLAIGRSLVPPSAGVPVPALVGKDEATARADLSALGLTPRVVPVPPAPSDVPGRVRRQMPAPGTTLPRGSEVTLEVATAGSAAAPPATVLVPSYLGAHVATAQQGLAQLGLGTTLAYRAGTPEGTVLAQDPVAGTSVAPGTPVVLTVAKAPTLDAVVLIEPRDRDSIARAYGVLFRWNPVSGAEDYELEVMVNKDDAWVVGDREILKVPNKKPNRVKKGLYMWHVRARRDNGTVLGPWSEWRRLSIYG